MGVKVGDAVKQGDTVVEISTDKVDMELPAPATGTITEILAQEGETVTVGQVIARMQAHAAGAPSPSTACMHPNPVPPTARPGNVDGGAHASPVARRIAAQQGVEPVRRHGSARGGRITKADVLAAKANGGNGATATAPPTPPRRPRPSPPAPS